MLQSSILVLARAVDFVGALTDTLQDYRTASYFFELWSEVEELAEDCKINVQTHSSNKLKIPRQTGDEHWRTEKLGM